MDSPLTWLIIALFYAPLHYAIPLLVVLFRAGVSPEQRKQAMIRTILDCTLSMGVAFALVIWLARDHLALAMGVLLLSLGTPYVRLLLVRSAPKEQAP